MGIGKLGKLYLCFPLVSFSSCKHHRIFRKARFIYRVPHCMPCSKKQIAIRTSLIRCLDFWVVLEYEFKRAPFLKLLCKYRGKKKKKKKFWEVCPAQGAWLGKSKCWRVVGGKHRLASSSRPQQQSFYSYAYF
jgi:hypothetical protein